MADVNFSQLTSASAVGAGDQLLIRLNNALSGSAGFARATTAIVEKGLGVYSTVQSNSAGWTQTLAFNSSNAQLTISNGNTISLSALSASSGGPFLPLAGGTMDENAIVTLDNNSQWRQSTPDIGIAGSEGFSIICGVGYEYKFAAGYLFILNNNSTQVRQVLYAPTTPSVNDDITLGYAVGTTWETADGTKYICNDNTDETAVWDLVSSNPFDQNLNTTDSPTFNEVTLTSGVINSQAGNLNYKLYDVVDSSASPYIVVSLYDDQDPPQQIGSTLIGFRGDGEGSGYQFLQGSTNNFTFEGVGNQGLADVTANNFTGTVGATTPAAGTFTTINLSKTITAAGITGARTINQPSGSVNFAAGATSLVVTNSLVTTSSVIICTVGTNDTTLKSVAAVAAAGSFTIRANAAATAETRVNFIITN